MWYKLWHIRKTNLQFAICNFHSSLFYFSRVYNNQSMNAIFRPIIFNGTTVTLILNFFFNFRSTSSDLPPLWLRCDSAFSSTDIPPIAVSLPSSKGSSLSLPYSQLSTPEKLQIANCKFIIFFFGSEATWAIHCLMGSALGEGIDWITRKQLFIR